MSEVERARGAVGPGLAREPGVPDPVRSRRAPRRSDAPLRPVDPPPLAGPEAASGPTRVLALFLRALMAARRSLALYPAGSEMAASWVHRFQRSLDGLFAEGLCFPVRIDPDRFTWAGQDLVTADPTLEAFRFDLEARGIRELDIDSTVRDWELQVLLDLLNIPGAELSQLGGAGAFLAGHGVSRVRVTAPADAGAAAPEADLHRDALRSGRDVVEVFVDAVLELATERLTELSYDRRGLTAWLAEVAQGDAARVYGAAQMLLAMAEGSADREVRARTVAEGLLGLPEPLLRGFFTDHLVPRAGRDVHALNLLSQLTEDELRDVAARLVPPDALLTLSSELLEFPWEEAKRRRLVESITSAVRGDELVLPEAAARAVVEADDPVLVELREEILAACRPEVLLERSAEVLLALALSPEAEDPGSAAFDAVEEIVGEALARGRLDLAVRVLSMLAGAVQVGGVRARERARDVILLQQRLAGRTHVVLVAGLLRRHDAGEGHLDLAAQYLLLLPRDAIQEFAAVLAEERERQVRARMCQVLVKAGSPAAPVLLGWLHDDRWFVARNAVHVLGKIGDRSVIDALVPLLGHDHPRVRIETARALAALAPDRATAVLGPLLRDPDPAVRTESVRALGALRTDDAVPALRALAADPGDAADLPVRREALEALAAIGSPAARSALEALAGRRPWPWQRGERRFHSLAVAALAAAAPAPSHDDE